MHRTTDRLAALTIIVLIAATPVAWGAADSGHDEGYVFTAPPVVKSSEKLKTGVTLTVNHSTGVTVSENPDSPWYQAVFFCQATSVMDAVGVHVAEMSLCEAIDGDGDVTWLAMLWWMAEGDGTFDIIAGTGKWKGIKGTGTTRGVVRERADHWGMTKWKIDWQIEQEPFDFDAAVAAGNYTDYGKGYSFHGPHVTESVRELTNGLVLDANTQTGMWIAEDPDNPLNHLKWRSHDTTVIDSNGEVLADILIPEAVDPSGDIIFMYQTWWYAEGAGETVMLGGTGKWKGITGFGRTLGALFQRADDHHEVESEFHWKIEK